MTTKRRSKILLKKTDLVFFVILVSLISITITVSGIKIYEMKQKTETELIFEGYTNCSVLTNTFHIESIHNDHYTVIMISRKDYFELVTFSKTLDREKRTVLLFLDTILERKKDGKIKKLGTNSMYVSDLLSILKGKVKDIIEDYEERKEKRKETPFEEISILDQINYEWYYNEIIM